MDRIRQAMTGRDEFFPLRVIGGTTAAALAVISVVSDSLDNATLILAGIAAVVIAFPWRRLAALKAGPFEFSLERAQVKGAIDSMTGANAESVKGSGDYLESVEGVEGAEKEKLEPLLSQLAGDIKRARGSRVLWVDDRPTRLVAERRLFRALGIETVVVSSCRDAGLTLMRDNDFDLVITSLEKGTERDKRDDVEDKRNFAILFIGWLRGREDSGIRELMGTGVAVPVEDVVTNNLAVVIYAAFPLSYIRQKIQPLADLEPAVEASRSLDDLLKKVIRSLADLRSNPIKAPPLKKVSSS